MLRCPKLIDEIREENQGIVAPELENVVLDPASILPKSVHQLDMISLSLKVSDD